MAFASKTNFCLNNLTILRPRITKILPICLKNSCEFPHRRRMRFRVTFLLLNAVHGFKVLICEKKWLGMLMPLPLPYEDLIKFSNSFATENEKKCHRVENDSAEISIRYLFFKDLFQALEGLSYFKQCSHSILQGQFHQYFMTGFFVQKCFEQLFCTYSSALYSFGKRILAQKLLIKCWWNWPLVGSQTYERIEYCGITSTEKTVWIILIASEGITELCLTYRN